MTQSANITIEFDNCADGSQECSGRLMKISSTEYTPRSTIYFDVWGVTAALLSGLSLWKGGKSLGSGAVSYHSGSEITENISFEGEQKKQLTYPMHGGSFAAIAKTDIMSSVEDTGRLTHWATQGQRLSKSKLKKIGYSCVGSANNSLLYGTIKITYTRATHRKRWSWLIPAISGDYYFYLCEGSTLLFSEKCTVDASGTEDVSPQDISIIVKEYTTEAVISGASVYIDGSLKGTTDESGIINIIGVSAGSHSLKITKAGYVSSEEDDLENDSFVIGNDT